MSKKLLICVLILVSILVTGCKIQNDIKDNDFENGYISISEQLQLKGDIRSINILADVGNVIVKKGQEYSIKGENLNMQWLSVSNQNGEITLEYIPPKPDDAKKADISKHNIIIVLPEKHKMSKFISNVGTGKLTIDNVNIDDMYISNGTGDIILNNVLGKQLFIECGAGNVKGNSVIFDEYSEFGMSSGNIDIKGDLSGKIYIEGGTGKATFDLQQPEKNYVINGEYIGKKVFINGEAKQPINNSSDSWEIEYDEGNLIDNGYLNEEKTLENGKNQAKKISNPYIINIEGGVGDIYFNFR